MEDIERKKRLVRLEPHLILLRDLCEPKAPNKASLMQIMKDLKDEGNTLFKESSFKEAGLFYSYALIVARQMERTFYELVDRAFLTVLYCNASLCGLKIKNYKEALKDAEAALTFQPTNLKAMYRRASALDGLGQPLEALKQALKGQEVDTKNNFDELIVELRAKLNPPSQPRSAPRSKEVKDSTSSKSSSKSSTDIKAPGRESSQSTADKKKEQAKDMNSKKKKKGQSQQQQASKKKQAAVKTTTPQTDDSDRDSDSTDNDGESLLTFAQRMASVQGSANTLSQKGSSKATGGSSSTTSVHANSNSGRATPAPGTSAATSKGPSGVTMGPDNFNVVKKNTKDAKGSRPTKPTIFWPVDQLNFRLVCRLCFVKEKEGVGGYTYRPNYSHTCLRDMLIVHAKTNESLKWLKIRPRFVNSGIMHTSQYKLCLQFQRGTPCRLGEANCTFAHSPQEIKFWSLDRDGVFNIAKFVKEARDKGVFSSDMAELISSEPPAERYIPGMATNGRPGAGSVSLSSAQPVPGLHHPPPPFHQPPPTMPTVQENKMPSAPSPAFSMPPPSSPGGLLPGTTQYSAKPQVVNQPAVSANNQPQMFNTPQLNPRVQLNSVQSAPAVANPFPHLECRVLCPMCLQYIGRPWFYSYNSSIPHQCQQSILAYKVKDDLNRMVWVQVRERASHRSFKGNYVLCHSVLMANPDLCKFKDSCSFAHSKMEQAIWKLEQEGLYDIGEYMMRNKLLNPTSNVSFSGNAQSPSGMYVRSLLDKFGGYFRFICRDCFFAPRPMISSVDSSGTVCRGSGQHDWKTARIIAHVKDTAFTPVDERKFHHDGAFFLLCNYQIYCQNWFSNSCRFAHSKVERDVWMLERDTKISRDELVQQSASLFTAKQTMNAPPSTQPSSGQAPRVLIPKSSGSDSQGQCQTQGQARAKPTGNTPPLNVTEYCRTCWGKGQRSEEDKGRDKCVRGHSNFKLNSAFVSLPTVKEIRSLPSVLRVGMKLILCDYYPKCTRHVCNHPHGQEELEIWSWMLRNDVKTLREVSNLCKEAQKQKTRKIDKGESVISVVAAPPQTKSMNQIIAPGDLHIHEHYCQYCGTSCNSVKQWDEHCMSERHINNVNSDREHQWNFRQPPWGQGKNLDLCAKHLHNKSCQYSYVPDMYNMCNHAHSQEELDEWKERFEWRQMKRSVAKDRNMFSFTESLLDEYHSQGDSVNVISDSIPDVHISCNEAEVLYRIDKNDIFTWIYEIRTQKILDKVALVHNRDRLHFKLLSSTGGHHQMAPGEAFLDVDNKGKRCYKVTVHFNGGIFGSFSQWVVFDFGSRPVLRKKLSVEIGDQLQHDRVKELRKELDFDRWTSQNRQIVRMGSELVPDRFTEQLLNKYKEPSASEDVVTSHSLTELNQHNYIHKMHSLLELEEITRQAIISSYNLSCDVTFSKTLQEPGMFLIGINGDLFIKVDLAENLTQDTLAGKLVLSSVRTALLARAGSTSKKVYEVSLVGENNYGYDGRGKEYVYLVINAETSKALGVSQGQKVCMELQFQMDRRFFCRMHHALDSMHSTDVVFPDVVKFKPDINELNALSKIRSSVLNEDQMIAVRHIVVQRDGYTPPFVMYGPFGTGKTETLAQATMTLLRERKESCRILICTQSNSAADLYITKHLHDFVKKDGKSLRILRLNAEERHMNTVPEEVLGFCHYPNKKAFEIPSKEKIRNFHLVLTTVENSLVLSSLGLHGCFTHIFVDEAGQTLECEILMPLSLATTKTCVVLTGDHHQIGPTVYSQEARRQNFGVSILVRLFNYYDSVANCGINLVSDRCQKSPLNIFLSINYRTKQEILRFISSVFYGGPDSLKAYGKIPSIMGITPLMLYAVQGRESQNVDSTSYLNHAEAQEVVARVSELLDNWPAEWGDKDPSQVAVISTYSDQVKHIRKMLRQDRRRPLLSHVDVGPIHSFQGKEVRALFITAVRTSNLLREPHIIRSLEANEDIGNLGFMSDPKLLNTALTRTQSFVAVVGDPSALCSIGECTQIWRTYLKHCSNMGSVRPMSYTYDAVYNIVRQIHLGPEGRVIDMISKRGQESFKHILNVRKSTKPAEETIKEATNGGGDADIEDRLLDMELYSYTAGVSHPSANGVAGWGQKEETSVPKKSHLQHPHRDELAANAETISDDILYQLARECQGGAATASSIQPEGISVVLEKDGLVVLNYSPRDSGTKQVCEPFKVISEDNDFVAFRVSDEDTGLEGIYENWSKEKLKLRLRAEPARFFKGVLIVRDRDLAVAVVTDAVASTQMSGKHFEIRGSLNRGHALNGDTVVVEALGFSEDVLLGQVKGILKRAEDPYKQLCVCVADWESPGLLTPINTTMPRFYTITSTPHVALARKGYVCVYKFDSRNFIQFSSYEKVDAASPDSKSFIVRYLFWQPGLLLPCGVVVGVIKQNKTLEQGMKLLDVEHNVQHDLLPQTLKEAESLFPVDSIVPTELLENRHDLTQTFCFSMGDSLTQDLELVISVTQIENLYEVGLHVTDVAAYVDKDSIMDQECELRGASLFPLGQDPVHMLPHQAATDLCSMRPGLDRLALSVLIRVDGEGKVCGSPQVSRSIINNKRHFSHAEVEDILLAPEEAADDYLKSCIIVLYQLAFLWRQERLGNAHFFSGLEPEKRLTQHSHLILHEVKLQFDIIVADILLTSFPETTPLLIQPPPQVEKLEKWKQDNAVFAMNSIPMTRAFLEDKVCRCATACTCVFSYIRQHRLENVKHLAMLKESWLMMCQAVSEEYQDFDLAQELIASPEHLPRVWLSAHRLAQVQQEESYTCSDRLQNPRDRAHYGLCLQACTKFSSPLRKFISLVVQRMLAAHVDGAPSPYTSAEMSELCEMVTLSKRDGASYHRDVFLLHLSLALKVRPLVVTAVVEGVDTMTLTLNLGPSLSGLSSEVIKLCLLSPATITAGQSRTVQIDWLERIYQYPDCDSPAQYSSCIKLDADRLVCNIPFIPWQKLLIAVREKKDDLLEAYVTELSQQVDSEMELRSANQPQVLSDQSRHVVPFSLALVEGQSVSVQLSAQLQNGRLQPYVQLLQLTSCLAICLEHKTAPEQCFTYPGVSHQAQVTYNSEVKYVSDWLLPALALESARQAVERGDRVTIHGVSIFWSIGDTGRQDNTTRISGTFTLTREFCERSSFWPNSGSLLTSALLDGDASYSEDINFSLDYLCVRYSDLAAPEDLCLVESVAAVVNTPQLVTWVGHCHVTEVKESAHGFQVKVTLVQTSMRIPELLLNGGDSALCTLEWICKTEESRTLDSAARGLLSSAPFVKDIITGKKPLNTLDPIPVDNSVIESMLHPEQEGVIAECCRQPFVTVVGGAGTGKTLMAAQLSHLLVSRNRTTDTFWPNSMNGPSNQLMVCAPTEKSLDVITGYLQHLNSTHVHMVRVYSQEVEERDFPLLLTSKQRTEMLSSCAVMKDLALHHRIRQGDSPEVKELLEQELFLAMSGSQMTAEVKASMERAQMKELRHAQVILCTALTSARPVLRAATNIRQIVMDDAGLIPEVEAIVPLVMHHNVNQLVLFGDTQMPHRKMSSQLASRMGLSRPLLLRYAQGATVLKRQFRTTASLARFPFMHFYNEDLEASPTHGRVQAPVQTIPWPGQAGTTCVFCHVQGEENCVDGSAEIVAGTGSEALFNAMERQAVADLVKSLLGYHRVTESSILVLTATQSQAAKIQEAVPLGVEVSSVLESIGRESDYVILSTVRSVPSATLERPVSAKWTREHMGNMADAGIVNLAITRAKSALFILGNKDLLECCEAWRSLLSSFRQHQCLLTDWPRFLESLKRF